MRDILFIGIGGFCGAVMRYVVSGAVHKWSGRADFPFGTLVVNLLGCLAIGLLAQLAADRGIFGPGSRAFFFIGVLGAFTTFSTFGNETMNLLSDGESLLAFLNIAVHVLLGLAAVWAGRLIAIQF